MSGARPDTWMPWYIGDYLRKTMHLDADEDGAYRRLIDATWVAGGLLVASDKEMAIIAKLPLKKWLAIKATVAKFFEITEEGWRHGRVSEELAKAERIVSARSAGGKQTAERRWGNGRADSSSVAEQSTEPIAEQVAELPFSGLQSGRPSPSPSPSPSPEERPPKAPRKRVGRLVGQELEQFEAWYAEYPRHEARGAAERAFPTALKIASFEQLMAGVRSYAQNVRGRERDKIAHPATWLNGERWKDERAQPNGSTGGNGVSEYRTPRSPPPRPAGFQMGSDEADR